MAHECPLCPEDEACPGKHCLVELADVVAFIRTLVDGDQVAESVLQQFDWPPVCAGSIRSRG